MKRTNYKIKHILSPHVITIMPEATLQEASILLSEHLVSDLMVIDKQGCFRGVLSEGDLLRAIIPNYEEIIEISGGTLERAFQYFVTVGQRLAHVMITDYIIQTPIILDPEDEPLKAAVIMLTKQIRRLPVVKEEKLLGTVSRADLCRALLVKNF